MTVQILSNVGPDRIDIAYERLGDPAAPPVLLIMGLGVQLIGWPDGFCDALVAHNLQAIRFDNRDAGLSTHFSSTPVPDFVAALAGDTSSAAYTLSAMAADAVGLLDGLDIASAHLVGASMGGCIAQTIAIEHPARVRSLTSMMSTTGDPTVGQPWPQARAVFASPPATNRDEAIQRTVNAARILGSPGFPADLDAVTDRAARAYDRSYDPPGIVRQAVAVIASGDRTARLRSLDVPALVIHGTDDPVWDVSGGRATAAAIPGATLAVFDGMGHDLPRALWPDFASRIAELVRTSSSA
jgi:pimeloyl-ACP methyl ester carboxylesterase